MQVRKAHDMARAIKTQRMRLGLTQQEVAASISVTRQTYARMERGEGSVSIETYLHALEILKLEMTIMATGGVEKDYAPEPTSLMAQAISRAQHPHQTPTSVNGEVFKQAARETEFHG